jgi:hypothetical protein
LEISRGCNPRKGINTPRPERAQDASPETNMPSTHISLHYHLIFSTKDRVAHLHKDWRHRLHSYMGGILNDLGAIPETIGGVEDHEPMSYAR